MQNTSINMDIFRIKIKIKRFIFIFNWIEQLLKLEIFLEFTFYTNFINNSLFYLLYVHKENNKIFFSIKYIMFRLTEDHENSVVFHFQNN